MHFIKVQEIKLLHFMEFGKLLKKVEQTYIHQPERLLLAYYVFGSSYIFSNQKDAACVEVGLCHVEKSSGGVLNSNLSEPLIAIALKNYFEDEKNPIEKGNFFLYFHQIILFF